MKRRRPDFLKWLMTIIPLVIVSCAHRWAAELPATHPDARRVYESLDGIVIPRVDLVDVPVIDAINFLVESSRKYEPRHRGVSMVLTLGPEHAAQADPSTEAEPLPVLVPPALPAAGEAVPVEAPPASPQPRVTIRGDSMRYLEVLDRICRQAGLVWCIEPRYIRVSRRVEPTGAARAASPPR